MEKQNIKFGTWQIPHGLDTYIATKRALELGYYQIDTAFVYGNEPDVGKAILDSSIEREKLTITTKLWNNSHGYDKTIKAFEKSIENLKLSYLDIYMIHWPIPRTERNKGKDTLIETYQALLDLKEKGKIKKIGVSNFKISHLNRIYDAFHSYPDVLQMEYHPGYVEEETISYCKEHSIEIEAWSPFGSGTLVGHPIITKYMKRYDANLEDIILSFCAYSEITPVVRATKEEHLKRNIKFRKINFTEEEFNELKNIKVKRIGHDPDTILF